MKKVLVALGASLAMLTGCGGNDGPAVAPVQDSTGAAYDWTKDPAFSGMIVHSDPKVFGFDDSYDKSRVKPLPDAVPGTLNERLGYIENQWIFAFDKDTIPSPALWETVTHKATFVPWVSQYIPYPIKVMDTTDISDGWTIEADLPSEKVAGIDGILKGLVNQGDIWIVRHPKQVLPQFDTPDTRAWWTSSFLQSSTLESPTFGDMKTINGSASWHLSYIGIDQLVAKGVDFRTDIGTGVIDGGLNISYRGTHNEDLSASVEYLDPSPVPDTNDYGHRNHGTAVVGAIAGSIFDNGKGVRGVVQGKTVFVDFEGTDGNFREMKRRIQKVIAHPFRPRVINMSMTLGEKTYGYYSGMLQLSNFRVADNYSDVKQYRDVFAANPDVLFVVSAMNSGVDSMFDNGMVHYVYDSVAGFWKYQPLDNVMVVGANGPDNVLHGYSDYGDGVDISAPAGYMALRCIVDDGGKSNSFYYTLSNEAGYGLSPYSPVFSGTHTPDGCKPGVDHDAFFGTSAAAPLVSGAAVLLFSADPLLTPKDVKNYLTQNSLVGNKLRYAGERWKTSSDGKGTEKTALDKPLPILDVAVAYDAVIANKKAIEEFSVSTRDTKISIIDSNTAQDEYFSLVVNGTVIGKVENPPGGTTTYPVTLKSGSNLIELRIANYWISDTRLTMKIDPDGIKKEFYGDDMSYAWTVKAPGAFHSLV
ncbi:MAG: S8 family serine peptidase [Candidatus Gracilibacteria bacterium]|nr:S8 family serine peptidase [Candidatus Gracilibacteria bacterium]